MTHALLAYHANELAHLAKIKPIRVEGLRLVRCTTHFVFCGGRVQGNISCTEQREATPMTFMKPLNLLVVCAAFVFLGAIVFGLL